MSIDSHLEIGRKRGALDVEKAGPSSPIQFSEKLNSFSSNFKFCWQPGTSQFMKVSMTQLQEEIIADVQDTRSGASSEVFVTLFASLSKRSHV